MLNFTAKITLVGMGSRRLVVVAQQELVNPVLRLVMDWVVELMMDRCQVLDRLVIPNPDLQQCREQLRKQKINFEPLRASLRLPVAYAASNSAKAFKLASGRGTGSGSASPKISIQRHSKQSAH
jgi:hypothetical protein